MNSRLRNLRVIVCLIAVATFAGCNNTVDTPVRYTDVTTIQYAGSGLVEPYGLAVNGDTIYVSDGANGTVREIRNGNSTILASGLNTPSAIAVLRGGDLAVADTGSHTIRRISSEGAVTIIAGVGGVIGSADGPASGATFNAPVGLAADADGTIYVADTYNDRIRVIRDDVVSTIAGSRRGFADGSGVEAKFDSPLGLAIWNDKLLIADSGNARIRVMDKTGGVQTMGGSNERGSIDGLLSAARFVRPTTITTDSLGRIFVVDDDTIRVIGARIFPSVETLAGDRRGYSDTTSRSARFNRPSGLGIGRGGEIYVTDSDNGAVRIISDVAPPNTARAEFPPDPLPLASRWPFDPPDKPREIAGTLGEIRGELGPENKPVWFHNGLDIAGAYGEVTKFIRDETVLDPHSAENFGTSRELLRLPLIGYIHLRLGRDKENRPFGDPRFQFDHDAVGKIIGLRVRRGTRFRSGDAIGTLNAMNHVHLIAGRGGREINALAAITLPGIGDSIAPVIEDVALYTEDWKRIEPERDVARVSGKLRVVARAYDRMDGNSERRRLGVYRLGYQLLSADDAPLGDIAWTIRFDLMPENRAVPFAYAIGSQSGYTGETVFNYIVTNRIDGDSFEEGFFDTTGLPPGKYMLRVFASDHSGNLTSRDVRIIR